MAEIIIVDENDNIIGYRERKLEKVKGYAGLLVCL